MSVTIQSDSVPLRVDEDGAIRVGGTRVTLDVLLADYRNGASPETIAEELDVLTLADVYGALAYYHRHRDEVDEYLRRREEEAEAIRREVEAAGFTNPQFGELMKKRWAERNRTSDEANGS